jgi:hypothetical protein
LESHWQKIEFQSKVKSQETHGLCRQALKALISAPGPYLLGILLARATVTTPNFPVQASPLDLSIYLLLCPLIGLFEPLPSPAPSLLQMTCLFTYTLTVDNLLSSFNYRFWIAVGGTSVPLSPKIMGKKHRATYFIVASCSLLQVKQVLSRHFDCSGI